MAKFSLTPDQARAVEIRDRAVLVSAAAGSGKTRVLTERLIARVLEGEDITRFLVITFTRAAAAELQGRILAALNERLAQAPGDRRLRRQSALLYRAQIGTIDSFCTTLVRENAHMLGISPGFSVLDEDRAQAMRARALEEVLDRAYEGIGENDGLRLLVDSVGAGRDDRRLADIVLELDDKMRSRAFPEQWAREKLAALDVSGLTDAGQTVWGAWLLEDTAAEAAYRAQELERALAVMALPGNEPLMQGYGDGFVSLAARFRDAARAAAEGWDRTRAVLLEPYPRLGAVRKFPDEETKARVKRVWDDSKAAAEKLKKTLAGDSESLLRGTAASRPAMEALMELVSQMQRAYGARKRRADACDFGDVEHFCVTLLCDETGGPSALAKTVSGRFAEVMVDEYQDVNAVQELIFQRISGEGSRLFMVGDVKQSVYRFRLAEPAIFNQKFAAFADPAAGERVLLRENFRSRGAVLSACNAVFGRIMSPALGEVAYDDQARLVQGAAYPPAGEVKPELCVLEPGGAQEGETPDKLRAEAQYVAGRIKAMVEGGETVSDGGGGMRPVTYGDIAVLLRTPGTSGAAFRRALTEAGVSVNARQGGAFFSQPEVSFALAMLAAADNPRQDVPVIAALRGLPFAFTPEELAAVRACGQGDFWDALCLRAQADERCARFVDTLQELRSRARDETTNGLLRWLYDKTGLLALCGIMPDGAQRCANLMQLYDYADRFEQDGGRGLFRFVGWLRELERRGLEPAVPAGGGAVQIMSIHKSKGLEFPVVFLADTGHRWARRGSGQVLCHSELGLGMRMTDAVRGVTWPTLPWRAIDRREKQEELSEQERVLYVAMTRARERLIITCVQERAAERVAEAREAGPGPISPRVLLQAQCPAQWLVLAAGADGGQTMDMKPVEPSSVPRTERGEAREPEQGDPALADMIARRLDWVYPHAGAAALPSKLTATAAKELAPAAADPEAAELPEDGGPEKTGPSRVFRRPDLGGGDTPLTGTERGVAAHLVMQYIDFSRTGSAEAVAGEIERLRQMGFLDERQARAVSPEDILAFFRSDLGKRVLGADRVLREFRFSLLCPAEQWFPQAPPGEEVLLQGVVDCCLEERGVLTVIDFKTDGQVEPERYRAQLAAYAMAMERIFGQPVGQTVLWYLRRRCMAEVKRPET